MKSGGKDNNSESIWMEIGNGLQMARMSNVNVADTKANDFWTIRKLRFDKWKIFSFRLGQRNSFRF
jgi:hypothetical protein